MSHAGFHSIIIGAGMSGLAAGIRLAMFDKKVLILEKHSIAGGLNSYYQRKNLHETGVRKFDVGLHALTNFMQKGEKAKPFGKLLKQLRLPYESFGLKPQNYSEINFPDAQLKFSNDFSLLQNEVHQVFPKHMDEFNYLVSVVKSFNELDLNQAYSSSREKLKTIISDPLLIEMLLAPLLIYGSAWENDMDFAQFVVMFKSIYLEGFAQPKGGVRTIINMLLEKYQSLGGQLHFKEGVEEIILRDNKAIGVRTDKAEYLAENIFSSAGLPETYGLCSEKKETAALGRLSFTETILCLDKKIPIKDFDSTIIFYNDSNIYKYEKPQTLFDTSSAVFCCPDNYDLEEREGEGMLRITYMANYEMWKAMERSEYLEEKERVYEAALKLTRKLIPKFNQEIRFKDVFTPTTIERYTWHKAGTVYGSTEKSRNGKTHFDNLYVIGTDQGFLGIVGAMLSGISMANSYGLMEVQ